MKLILTLILLSMIFQSKAQSGKIIYEERAKMNINIEGEHAALMNDLPKERTGQRELIFNENASLFTRMVRETAEEQTEGGNRMIIRIDEPDDKMYCDLKERKRIEQRDFMSRKFLIEIPFDSMKWKTTSQTKNILGYECQEAILQDTARTITAWFTPRIPVSTGPYGICNLPGLVLAAELNGGDLTFEAKKIDLTPVDPAFIVKPTDGKKITREEFNKVVKEKQEEMGEENGGNGNIIIRVRK